MENRRYNAQQNQGSLVHRGSATAAISPEATKVLRNTYTLLAMTLLFSAAMAGLSMSIGLGRGASLMCSLGALALVWLVLPRTANSSAGIAVVFAFTGLLGLSLGPILLHYLQMANGGQIIMQALGAMVAGMFGVEITAFSLAISAAIVFLMSGFILYDTSRIVNGGETNYILATTGLYLNIYNLFLALLHLLGAFGGDD